MTYGELIPIPFGCQYDIHDLFADDVADIHSLAETYGTFPWVIARTIMHVQRKIREFA